MPINSLEEKILFAIPTSTTISSKSIARMLEIPERTVRRIIHNLVKKGYPIGSTTDGYYKITTKEQLDVAIAHLMSRNISVFERVNALKKLESRFNGQIRMEV